MDCFHCIFTVARGHLIVMLLIDWSVPISHDNLVSKSKDGMAIMGYSRTKTACELPPPNQVSYF